MDIWVVFHTLYLSFIKVLGSWSEVPACEESSRLGWAGTGCGTNWCAASFSALTLWFLPAPVHHGQAPTEQQSVAFCLERSPPGCGCPGCRSGRDCQLGLRL